MPVKNLFTLLTLLAFAAISQISSAATKELTWAGCGISKKGFMNDLAKAYEQKTGIKIKIEGGGATKGLRQVASGKLNLGGSCRLPLIYKKDDGTTQVVGVERNLNIIPMGWDALVVIVNKQNNMVDSISTDQLKDLFTGKINNWKQLDGKTDKPINLYVRKGKISGVGLTLRQQLFNNPDQEFSSKATVLKSSGKIEAALEKDPYGIAVSGISSSRHRNNLSMLKLDGVEPTMKNLRRSKYKLYRILFLVAPNDYEKNPDLKAFVDFAISIDGQNVIEQAGTLPYRKGFGLLRTAASFEYLRAMDIVDREGMYSLGGH